MIIVTGIFEVDAEDHHGFAVAARAVTVGSRREPGCKQYVFAADLDRPGLFRIYEEWETAEDLEAHYRSPHLTQFRDVLSGLRLVRRDLSRFDAQFLMKH